MFRWFINNIKLAYFDVRLLYIGMLIKWEKYKIEREHKKLANLRQELIEKGHRNE